MYIAEDRFPPDGMTALFRLYDSVEIEITHWPLADLEVILNAYIQTQLNDPYLEYFLWNQPPVNAIRLHRWYISVDSGNI